MGRRQTHVCYTCSYSFICKGKKDVEGPIKYDCQCDSYINPRPHSRSSRLMYMCFSCVRAQQ